MVAFKSVFSAIVISVICLIASAQAQKLPPKPSCSDNSMPSCADKAVGDDCNYPGSEGGKGRCNPDEHLDCKCTLATDPGGTCDGPANTCSRPGSRCKVDGKPGICLNVGVGKDGLAKCECDTDSLLIIDAAEVITDMLAK